MPYLAVEMPDAPLLHKLQGSILKTRLQSVSSIASTEGVVEPIYMAGGGIAEHEEVPASEVRARRGCSLPRALLDLCTLAELYVGYAWSFCWTTLVQILCRPSCGCCAGHGLRRTAAFRVRFCGAPAQGWRRCVPCKREVGARADAVDHMEVRCL